jgi:class 3 adenylate cyclase
VTTSQRRRMESPHMPSPSPRSTLNRAEGLTRACFVSLTPRWLTAGAARTHWTKHRRTSNIIIDDPDGWNMSGTPPKIPRHLAAIFAADVEGYSRLMDTDEVGTLRTLTAHREIMDRLIGEHGGRTANTAGDSVLAEFPSVVDAVPRWRSRRPSASPPRRCRRIVRFVSASECMSGM